MNTDEWKNATKSIVDIINTDTPEAQKIKRSIYLEIHENVKQFVTAFPNMNFGYDEREDRYKIAWKKYNELTRHEQLITLNIEAILYKTQGKEKAHIAVCTSKSPGHRIWVQIDNDYDIKNWINNTLSEIFVECV